SITSALTASLTKKLAKPSDFLEEMEQKSVGAHMAVLALSGAGVFGLAVVSFLAETNKLAEPGEFVQPLRATQQTGPTQLGQLSEQGRPAQQGFSIAVIRSTGHVMGHRRHRHYYWVVPRRAHVANCSCAWHGVTGGQFPGPLRFLQCNGCEDELTGEPVTR